jgi:hypothetical protein
MISQTILNESDTKKNKYFDVKDILLNLTKYKDQVINNFNLKLKDILSRENTSLSKKQYADLIDKFNLTILSN